MLCCGAQLSLSAEGGRCGRTSIEVVDIADFVQAFDRWISR